LRSGISEQILTKDTTIDMRTKQQISVRRDKAVRAARQHFDVAQVDEDAILANPKHEAFALGVAEGLTPEKAYARAGFAPDRHNAHRLLRWNGDIQRRVRELRKPAAEAAQINVLTLTQMLLEDRERARDLGQIAAAVTAVEKIAQLHGLMIDRKEMGRPGAFEDMDPKDRDSILDAIDRELALRDGGDASGSPPRPH
jgi:hypothetical protein